ncbi:MAG: hypothetical protein O7B26_04485 [Planctomycetota bacterium]|nr:hypothetical protein [Planctomycetota bacterium]
MNISPVSSAADVHRPADPPKPERPEKRTDLGPSRPPQDGDTPVGDAPKTDAVPAGEEDDGNSDEGLGVLRNLLAGHFKGVADVRLRINFFDELSAVANESAAAAASEEVNGLINTVNSQIDKLLSGLEIEQDASDGVAELLAGFGTAVDEGLDQFSSDGDREAFAQLIESAFDSFVQQLRDLLYPPEQPEAPSTDETDPADETAGESTVAAVEGEKLAPGDETTIGDTIETTPTPDDPLADLISAFSEALASFMQSISTSSQLPELSEPSGNGVAYDKFLAIYNEMLGGSTQVDEVV